MTLPNVTWQFRLDLVADLCGLGERRWLLRLARLNVEDQVGDDLEKPLTRTCLVTTAPGERQRQFGVGSGQIATQPRGKGWSLSLMFTWWLVHFDHRSTDCAKKSRAPSAVR